MRIVTIFCIVFLFMTTHLYSFEWPVEEKSLSASFGSNRYDSFYPSIEISASNSPVYPTSAGEIVYYSKEGDHFSKLPSGLGNCIVIQHEGGLKTVYGHLDNVPSEPSQYQVSPDDQIGVVGDTGYTYGRALSLTVFDDELKQIINPLLMLSSLPDTTAPVIKDSLLVQQEEQVVLEEQNQVSPGEWNLHTTIYDPSEHVSFFAPLAPHSVSLFINGEEEFHVNYEAIQEREGKLYLGADGSVSYAEYYLDDWKVNLGTLNLIPGRVRMEIIVQDINGNESHRLFTIDVVQQ